MEKDDIQFKRFYFWVSYLKAVSLFFAFLGAFWAIMGSFDPFGLYNKAFAQAFWNADTLPADAQKTFSFILGPFGATSAGYFILQFFIAKHAYSYRQLWGYNAVVVTFLVWLILDTSMCLIHKGYFNIMFANIPSFLAMLPVFFTRRYFTHKS